ncbi:uncharacterized protein LOC144872280 [Branchiostoma floridae x Branchiostoma japonicum]
MNYVFILDTYSPYHFCNLFSDSTPIDEPQTDWQARADAAAKIPNPIYASRADTTPMQQPQTDWQARADAVASIPNLVYASRAAATTRWNKCVRRCRKVWNILGPLVAVFIAVLSSYFAVTALKEVGKLQARVQELEE